MTKTCTKHKWKHSVLGIKKVGKQYAVSVIAEYVGVKLFQIKQKEGFSLNFKVGIGHGGLNLISWYMILNSGHT